MSGAEGKAMTDYDALEFGRFMDKVSPEPNSGCWLWTGGVRCGGYGQLWSGGKQVVAHRFAYEQFVGPIPSGLTLDHLCRVRCCVNPRHLEPVTQKENVLRGFGPTAENKRTTHCQQGHEYTPENTLIIAGVSRRCRTCNRKRNVIYGRTRRAEARRARA
jgi:hypothetical protein